MFKKQLIGLIFMFALALLAACGGNEPVTLTLMTHDSFSITEAVLQQFEEETGIAVELLPSGDAGEMLNQAILAKDAPLGDVIYGIDNAFMSRALNEGILLPYESAGLSDVRSGLALDDSHQLTPINFGDVCLNYDVAYFAEAGLEPPTTLATLADPAYQGLLVVEDPGTSSPGLAFMMATIAEFGEEGDYTYLDYWADLRANDVMVTAGWSDAYYGAFTVASDGDRPVVVSYATSPPAEVIFAEPAISEAPSAAVLTAGTCFRQVEFAGILKGTEHEEEAQQLIDFMLSVTFQEDIPLNMFVFPSNANAELPAEFVEYSDVATSPATLDPAAIEANRERWIEAWADTVLR